MEHPQKVTKTARNNHKLCNETGHHILSLMESQQKLRQQYNQNFTMEGRLL